LNFICSINLNSSKEYVEGIWSCPRPHPISSKGHEDIFPSGSIHSKRTREEELQWSSTDCLIMQTEPRCWRNQYVLLSRSLKQGCQALTILGSSINLGEIRQRAEKRFLSNFWKWLPYACVLNNQDCDFFSPCNFILIWL
jgi:hypothetical protein